MIFQIFITVLILIFSLLIIYKNIKKQTSGECNCSHCSCHCSAYTKENKDNKNKDNADI